MNKLVIGVVAAMSLASFGCKKKGGGDDGVKKFAEFKDAMCKCGEGDTACANKVLDDQKKYGEEMAKTADKNAKPDPDLAKKMEPIMAEYTKCSTKAMTPKIAKPDDKKPDDKKPDDKKPDDKKPAAGEPHKAPAWLAAVAAQPSAAKVGQFAWTIHGDAFDSADGARVHVEEIIAVDGNVASSRPLALMASGPDAWKHKPDPKERPYAGLPGQLVIPAHTVDEVKPKPDDIVFVFMGNTPSPILTRVKSVEGGLVVFTSPDAMGTKLVEQKTDLIEPYGTGIAPFTLGVFKDGTDQKLITILAVVGDKVFGYAYGPKLVQLKKSDVKALKPDAKERKVGDKVVGFAFGNTSAAGEIKEVLIPKFSYKVGYSSVGWEYVFDKLP